MEPSLLSHRLELKLDGLLILGTSIKKRPDNHAEMIAILQELIETLSAPDVKDNELF